MQLPTVSGEAVLQAFGKGAGPMTQREARTTRLWGEFLPQAGQEEYRSRRHAWEADRLNQARGRRSPDR